MVLEGDLVPSDTTLVTPDSKQPGKQVTWVGWFTNRWLNFKPALKNFFSPITENFFQSQTKRASIDFQLRHNRARASSATNLHDVFERRHESIIESGELLFSSVGHGSNGGCNLLQHQLRALLHQLPRYPKGYVLCQTARAVRLDISRTETTSGLLRY